MTQQIIDVNPDDHPELWLELKIHAARQHNGAVKSGDAWRWLAAARRQRQLDQHKRLLNAARLALAQLEIETLAAYVRTIGR